LSFLGEKVKLCGFTKFSGGLDTGSTSLQLYQLHFIHFFTSYPYFLDSNHPFSHNH
jgi:hypothetical protein